MRLSIITPTIGRPSLVATIDSVAAQMAQGDEHIIIADGANPAVAAEVAAGYERWHQNGLYIETPPTRRYGSYQRHIAIPKASGDYLMFLDDDDILAPGALETVRRVIAEYPGRPLMFRLVSWAYPEWPDGFVAPRENVIKVGCLGGSNLVCPNDPERLGDWNGASSYQDFIFVAGTLQKYPPDSVVWRDEVIIECRPHMKDNTKQNGSSTPSATS